MIFFSLIVEYTLLVQNKTGQTSYNGQDCMLPKDYIFGCQQLLVTVSPIVLLSKHI